MNTAMRITAEINPCCNRELLMAFPICSPLEVERAAQRYGSAAGGLSETRRRGSRDFRAHTFGRAQPRPSDWSRCWAAFDFGILGFLVHPSVFTQDISILELDGGAYYAGFQSVRLFDLLTTKQE